MRINQFVAQASGLSRRKADGLIVNGQVLVNGQKPQLSRNVTEKDAVTLDGKLLTLQIKQTVMLNKPVGYVCSREGQGSKTIYALLPESLHRLKPVGRLDKDSSGLLLLTNDGELANKLTHPRYTKEKVYKVHLDKNLKPEHLRHIKQGVTLRDGVSKLVIRREKSEERREEKTASSALTPQFPPLTSAYEVRLREGRNRQIRRTFEALGYKVKKLHRIQLGEYLLGGLKKGKFVRI